MDQAALVGDVQRASNLADDRHRMAERELAALEQLAEVRPVDEAHRDVGDAVGLSCVVNRKHVGVVERGGDPRLPHESLAKEVVLRELGREQLQGHDVSELRILGAHDLAHAAATEDLLNLVTRKGVPQLVNLPHPNLVAPLTCTCKTAALCLDLCLDLRTGE